MAHLTPARVEHSDSRRGGDGLAWIGRLMVRMWQIRGNNLQNFRGNFVRERSSKSARFAASELAGQRKSKEWDTGCRT